jgi:hypothetical protein
MKNKLFERLVLNERQIEEAEEFVKEYDFLSDVHSDELFQYIEDHEEYDAYINRSNDGILSYMSVHENRLERLNERIKDFPKDIQEFLCIVLYLKTVMKYVVRDSIYFWNKYGESTKPNFVQNEISNSLCVLVDELFRLPIVKTEAKDHLNRYGD